MPSRHDDRQVAEQDVADDLAVHFGDQRQPDVAAVTQGIDQASLVLPAEREPVDLPDGLAVGRRLGPDDVAHETGPDARNSTRTRMRIRPSLFSPEPSPPSPQ